jgi:DsbC/DsbD-like thiol-disulfide interchange protein
MSPLRTLAAALIFAAAASTAGLAAAGASPWVDVPNARVRLVAAPARTASGGHLAGLEMTMAEGWHTYWRMPGDAGVPPMFDWAGSANAGSITVRFPAPHRMREAGAETIGYETAVLFPIEVRPQDAAKPVALKLALEFGICREICIPATATLELALPASAANGHANAIEAALDRVPRPANARRKTDPELRRVTIDGDAAAPRLSIEAAFPSAQGADVFVEAPEGLYVPLPKALPGQPGGLVRYEARLSPDLVRDLRGKTLTFTLVSDAGASEAQWKCC